MTRERLRRDRQTDRAREKVVSLESMRRRSSGTK